MSDTFDLQDWLGARRGEIQELLDRRVAIPSPDQGGDPGRLMESIRYSLLSPGKRLRPVLGLAAAQAVGAALTEPVRIATAAIELIHCYSLIHDDLPAMDDDDMRRGKPTNHKAFGEATAILAGDGLCTLAFEWIAEAGKKAGPDQAAAYLDACLVLAQAAGAPAGMVRGQGRDLGEAAPKTLQQAEVLHAEKTGALFRAAVEIGAVVGGATPEERQALVNFGQAYGIAFQHADDISDEEHQHLQDQARSRLKELTDKADAALVGFDERAAPLRGLANALANALAD